MLRISTAAVVSFLVLSGSAAAQTVTDARAWFIATATGRLAKGSRWRWSADGIVRSRDGVSTLDVTSVRPTLLYDVTTHASIGGGYVFVSNYPVSGGRTTEHRVFGIVSWTGAAAGGSLTLRSRLEDRLIEANSGPLWRARPMARFSHPLRPNSRLAWVGYDELSLHLNTTTRSPRGVDQNRAFVGIATTWSPRFRTEIGYLNQFVPGHGAANKMNHVVNGSLTMTF